MSDIVERNVRKRSRSSQEAGDPRAEKPAREESGSGTPDESKKTPVQAKRRARLGPRHSLRRSRSDDPQSEARKSRSKRRRERRKAVKSDGDASCVGRAAAAQAPAKRPLQKGGPHKDGGHLEFRAGPSGAPGPSVPRPREAPLRPALFRGAARRRLSEGGAHRRGQIEGLPPLSAEDLDAMPRNVSNLRGHARGRSGQAAQRRPQARDPLALLGEPRRPRGARRRPRRSLPPPVQAPGLAQGRYPQALGRAHLRPRVALGRVPRLARPPSRPTFATSSPGTSSGSSRCSPTPISASPTTRSSPTSARAL